MPAVTHIFVNPHPDISDPTIVRPSNWNDFHKIVYVGQNIAGAALLSIVTDVARLAAGTYAVTVPAASGTLKQITVCQDGAGTMTLTPTGGDTIGGMASFALTAVGQSCVLVDEAPGIWGLLPGGATTTLAGAYANGSSAASQTLALLDTKGGGVIVDGTAVGFTDVSALLVKGKTSNGVPNRVAVNVVGGTLTPTSGTSVLIGNLNQADTIFQPPSGTAAFIGLDLAYEFDPSNTSGTIAGIVINARSLGATGNVSNVYLINAFCNTISGTAQFLVQANGSTAILASPTDAIVPPSTFKVQIASNTHITASAESISVDLNLTAARLWNAGALTTQRDFVVRASSYAFTGASVVTTGATVAIEGAPTPGINATLTNPLSFWVQTGTSLFDNGLSLGLLDSVPLVSPMILSILAPATVDDPNTTPNLGNINIGATGTAQFLSMGMRSDGRFWFQGQNSTSTASNMILINPNGGGLAINTPSPVGNPAFFIDISVLATVSPSWTGINITAVNGFNYTGLSTTSSLLFVTSFGVAATVNSVNAWTITDMYGSRVSAAVAGTNVTFTHNWALQCNGSIQYKAGQQWHVRNVNATPYNVVGISSATADCVLQVTNAAATTINMPKISIVGGGWLLTVVDSRYNAAVANITLVPDATVPDKINNIAGNYTMNISGMALMIIANTTTNNWEFI